MGDLNIFLSTTQLLVCIFYICYGIKVFKESKESLKNAEARLEETKLEFEQQEGVDNEEQ